MINYALFRFYLIGALAGFSLTGLQAVSRMMAGRLSPPDKGGEFYGFFAIAGRSSSFLGPALYGWVAAEMALFFQSQGLSGYIITYYYEHIHLDAAGYQRQRTKKGSRWMNYEAYTRR